MDNIYSFDENLPIFSMFILVLIITGVYLIDVFPCRVRKFIQSNIYLKHFIGLLTMIFLVVITDIISINKSIGPIIIKSFILYIIFIFYTKTEIHFFIITLILLAIIYILVLHKNNINKKNINNIEQKKIDIEINRIIIINNILFIIVFFFIFLGFLIYMGKKKYQYKDKFNYITFLFGSQKCNDKLYDIKILESLKYSFN